MRDLELNAWCLLDLKKVFNTALESKTGQDNVFGKKQTKRHKDKNIK